MHTETIPDLMNKLRESKDADWIFSLYKMGRLNQTNLRRQLKRLVREIDGYVLVNTSKKGTKNEH
jgi:hypothetical protein